MSARALAASFVLVAASLFAAPAAAQPCVSCWNDSCPDLKSYQPKCEEKKPGATTTKKKPPTPTPAPTTTPTTEAQCSGGKVKSADTAGRCCWPGQAWNGAKCVGVPSSCPEGTFVDGDKETCTLGKCEGGTVRAQDGVHCCWAGQAYSAEKQQCLGRPSCPSRFTLEGDTCISPQEMQERAAAAQRAQQEQLEAQRRHEAELQRQAQEAERLRIEAEARARAEEARVLEEQRRLAEEQRRADEYARAQAAAEAEAAARQAAIDLARTQVEERRAGVAFVTGFGIDVVTTGIAALVAVAGATSGAFEGEPIPLVMFILGGTFAILPAVDGLLMLTNGCTAVGSIWGGLCSTPVASCLPPICLLVSVPEGATVQGPRAEPAVPERLAGAPASTHLAY
jgi:hypothetical protein